MRFGDELLRPFVAFTVIAVVAVELPTHRLIAAPLAVAAFVVLAVAAVCVRLFWNRLSPGRQIALAACYMGSASLLLPLAHTTLAPLLPYLAAAVAGTNLASRRAALLVAAGGSIVGAVTQLIVNHTVPTQDGWSWWLALTVGLPVYMGISNRDFRQALENARRATAEARRATDSEAREAALRERGRIAREIHDVLGHSLSGIALQLDMADALRGSGRDEEAGEAIRRARTLAVDSIAETRRAVHALREDTLPLPETLRLMAAGADVSFDVLGDPAPVAVETAQTVLRVAQEAVTNAVKYAPGAARTMTLAYTADGISLTVVNGPGPDGGPPEGASGTGMGLVGMRERAALVGGTLRAGPTVEDPARGGWTVKLEVPR
ncbi:sensor histidine kinase [Streptantibioticus cattleyicolor]|uniref:sensor histidine kinase n=1 Tax=Streptantibioticus cattleyicolor TaxID=29303 RepID=UPI001E5E4CDD|nr:histidine kinase [Streptantibioticus cattleyicolor]